MQIRVKFNQHIEDLKRKTRVSGNHLMAETPYHILLYICKFTTTAVKEYVDWWRITRLPTTCIY